MSVDEAGLVDRIYEAAVLPEHWPALLNDLAREANGAWAVVLTRRNDAWIGWQASPTAPPTLASYLTSEAAGRSEATARLLALDRAGFAAEHEAFSEAEYLADPLMAEWATPLGFHHAAATAIGLPHGDLAVVHLMRRQGEPGFEPEALARLDRFRPHLARAAMLAARWKMERLRAAAEALGLVGLPAAVLDGDCRVLVANGLVEGLAQHVVWLPRNGLAFKDRAASAALREGAQAAVREHGFAGRSLPVRGDDGVHPLLAHIVPLRGAGRDLFEGGAVLLVLSPVGEARTIDAALIRGLFDLTSAESQVAAGIARGLSLDAIARRNGVSRETVRTQLRSVLLKTGTARQAELAAKLGAVRGPL